MFDQPNELRQSRMIGDNYRFASDIIQSVPDPLLHARKRVKKHTSGTTQNLVLISGLPVFIYI